MAIAEELTIIIDAKVSQAVKDMKKVDKTLDNTSKTTSKLKDAFKAMAGPVAIGAVIAGMIKIGKESEKAFQVQEKAVAGVNAALKVTGQFTEEASQDMQDFASELQEVTTVGDEATLSLIQTALNMGLTADQAKEAARQAIGMSEAFGVGLDTSLRGSANAMLGNFDALTRYLPAIKTATTDAEKAAIVQKQLGDAFAIAEANALTSAGVQQQLSNSYGDLQETIGGVISLALTPYRENLKKEVESVNLSIQAHLLRKKALEGNATLVEELTLKQIEQQKTEEAIVQAKANIIAATNQETSEYANQFQQLQGIEKQKEAAIKQAELLLVGLEDELALRKIGTADAEKALAAENALTKANIELAQGVILVTDATGENTAAINEQAEGFVNLTFQANAYKNALMEATFAHRTFTDEGVEGSEEMEEASLDLANTLQNNMVRAIGLIAEELAMGELSFESFAKIAATGIASVLDALGAELLAIAATNTALSLGPIGIPAALAGAAAAFAAAGLIKGAASAFAEGGSFTTNGPQMIQVGDNSGGIEKVTVEPVSSAGANEAPGGGGGGGRYVLALSDGVELPLIMQQYIDNGNVYSSRGGRL